MLSGVSSIAIYLSDPSSVSGSVGIENSLFVSYPVAIPCTFVSLATNFNATVPTDATVTIQLFKNNVGVISFITTYAVGDSGVKTVPAPPPEAFAVGDEFFLLAQVDGLPEGFEFLISATIGVTT